MGKTILQKSLPQDLISSSCKCQSYKMLCKDIAWMYYGPWRRDEAGRREVKRRAVLTP